MCNIEFPHFGASYPDAHCINGYLWDMDSYENGCYTIGGDDPCPFCNTEAWLKTVLDNEEFASREEALAWVEKMREKWGAEHLADARKTSPKGLEEAAREYGFEEYRRRCNGGEYGTSEDTFIAGTKWQKEQDEKEEADLFTIVALDAAQRAKEQMVENALHGWLDEDNEPPYDLNVVCEEKIPFGKFKHGDKVRIIIVKEDEK